MNGSACSCAARTKGTTGTGALLWPAAGADAGAAVSGAFAVAATDTTGGVHAQEHRTEVAVCRHVERAHVDLCGRHLDGGVNERLSVLVRRTHEGHDGEGGLAVAGGRC